MADFNRIFTTSSLEVNKIAESKICFNDGKVIFNNKYSLANNTLLLAEDSKNTVSIYYNHGIGTTYEFYTTLNRNNVKLPAFDNYDRSVKDLIPNKTLLFINGILQNTAEYYIENGKDIYIKDKRTNSDTTFSIFVYSSSIDFQRVCYDRNPDTENPKIDDLKATNQKYLLDSIRVPGVYNSNNSFVFINGIKVDFNIIENITINKNSYSYIKINADIPEDSIETLEFVLFNSDYDNTKALHFKTEQGYLEYGPLDYYGESIPNTYDVTFTFNDQAKLIVDNLRYGFIIKEVNGYGEALITDTSFETRTIKGIIVQNFTKTNYTKTEYYLEVPEYTNIVKYLAEYDKKYTFLPEILTVFQRVILDEIQDTIQRMRDSKSIYKVDSVSINKLLSLLGNNLNIKTLNKKQRRELLEELNEFYRMAGTRDSYNLLNILQNNLKLIDMQQLFTPNGSYNYFKRPIYNYNIEVTNGGSGYALGDYLKMGDYPNLEGIVTDIEPDIDPETGLPLETGAIKAGGFDIFNQTGQDDLNLTVPLVSASQGIFTCSSSSSYYDYFASEFITSRDFRPGQILHTIDNSFNVTVDTVNPTTGQILDFTLSPQSGPTSYTLKNVQLYEQAAKFYKISLQSIATGAYKQIYYGTYNTPGQAPTVLEPGIYKIVISGAGGGGGSGDSEQGKCSDVEMGAGDAGEERTEIVYLKDYTPVSIKLGQGGGGAFAKGTWYWDRRNKGDGYEKGELGQNVRGAFGHGKGWIITSGQGGGSSCITLGDNKIIARGGNGGYAGGANEADVKQNTSVVQGGRGGSGGTGYSGYTGGAKGGDIAYPNTNFWSSDGEDGYIYIYKCNEVTHTLELLNDDGKIEQGDTFNITTPHQDFLVTAYKVSNKIKLELNPATTTKYVSESSQDTPSFVMNKAESNLTAKLNLTSTASTYKYKISLKGLNVNRIKVGDEFRNSDADINKQFIYTIKNINKNLNTYTGDVIKVTSDSSQPITLVNQETRAYYKTGEGAEITLSSTPGNQTLSERCYIDFFTKKELGAELKVKYVKNAIDYLYINEGTPKSPKWWNCTDNVPDIDYGHITYNYNDYIDYGLITETVPGKWVKWWEWDRNSIWYPTNHVIAEMKMPIDVDFTEFSKQFVEQFYNLASTVVYLHGIITSFYYGRENIDNTNPKSNTGASFGVAVGSPIMVYETTVTSNPYIQYKETNPDECTLTITPIPADALVTLEYGETIISGVGTQSITVPYNDPEYHNMVTWKVEKGGFKTKSRVRCVTKTKQKYVMLEAKYVKPEFLRTLTINPLPDDATVTLTAPGYEQEGNSITVEYGTTVLYSVTKENYKTQEGSVEITGDITLDITMEPLENFTIVVNPIPLTATVTLEAPSYETVTGIGSQTMTVLEGTPVTYTVSAEDFATYDDVVTPVEDTTINVTLQEGLDLSDYTYDITPTHNVTLREYIGEDTTITTPHL